MLGFGAVHMERVRNRSGDGKGIMGIDCSGLCPASGLTNSEHRHFSALRFLSGLFRVSSMKEIRRK